MFEPVRGGTRGGQAEFKWSDVSADKDRENYLGHSINAPTGRWQKNKDVHWYNRDVTGTEAERAEEIRKVKEAEAEAMSVALGFGPSQKTAGPTLGAATGANAVPGPILKPDPDGADAAAQKAAEKEDKRRRMSERKEGKHARKEQRRAERAKSRMHSYDEDDRRHRDRNRSRSRSPRRHHVEDFARRRYSRSRSRTPPRERREPRGVHDRVAKDGYDDRERERERERNRRRWENNTRKELPGEGRWGRR